jgi:hypothetical protein
MQNQADRFEPNHSQVGLKFTEVEAQNLKLSQLVCDLDNLHGSFGVLSSIIRRTKRKDHARTEFPAS